MLAKLTQIWKRSLELAVITPVGLIVAAFVAQIFCIRPLWEHSSDTGEVLGLYSYRYAVGLLAHIVLSVFWLVLLVKRESVIRRLQNVGNSVRYGVIAVSIAVVAVSWLLGIDNTLVNYAAINALFLSLLLIRTQPDQAVQGRRWLWVGGAIIGVMLVLLFMTALTRERFNPDESNWADRSTTLFREGGIYLRTWLHEPYVIKPGYGWSIAPLGWLYENVLFDVRVSRILNFAMTSLAIVGVGLVTAHLYGRQAALISVGFATLSLMFLAITDYRSNHQLAAGGIFTLYAALRARVRGRAFWHFVCGLLATLSLQLHIPGFIFAIAFSLFYVLEGLWNFYQHKRLMLNGIIWFGVGAAFGTGIYWVFNIQIIGGLDVFLADLVRERGDRLRYMPFLRWLGLFESVVIWSGLAYILWRRNAQDRVLLAWLACLLPAIAIFDTQGYRSLFNTFYVVPVGALLVDGLRTAGLERGQNRHVMGSAVVILALMAVIMSMAIINWGGVRAIVTTRQIPPTINQQIGAALRPYTRPDDVIVSTHELIWEFHQPTDELISVSAEPVGMLRWNLSNSVDVWRRVQPTVVIDVARRMSITDGLRVYMDEQDFQVCATLTAAGVDLTVYRAGCSGLSA